MANIPVFNSKFDLFINVFNVKRSIMALGWNLQILLHQLVSFSFCAALGDMSLTKASIIYFFRHVFFSFQGKEIVTRRQLILNPSSFIFEAGCTLARDNLQLPLFQHLSSRWAALGSSSRKRFSNLVWETFLTWINLFFLTNNRYLQQKCLQVVIHCSYVLHLTSAGTNATTYISLLSV